MGESIKALCSLFMIVAAIVAAVVWFDDQPNQTIWIVRVISPLVALSSLAALLKLHFRRNVAHDYLKNVTGAYFNRDGFCFLRTNSNFGNSFGTALTVAGALGGAIVLSSPVTVKIPLPTEAVDELPLNSAPSTNMIWKLGDPPILQTPKA